MRVPWDGLAMSVLQAASEGSEDPPQGDTSCTQISHMGHPQEVGRIQAHPWAEKPTEAPTLKLCLPSGK